MELTLFGLLLAADTTRGLRCDLKARQRDLDVAGGAAAVGARRDALQRRIYRDEFGGFMVVRRKLQIAFRCSLRGGVGVSGKVVGGGLHPPDRAAPQGCQLGQQRCTLLQELFLEGGEILCCHGGVPVADG